MLLACERTDCRYHQVHFLLKLGTVHSGDQAVSRPAEGRRLRPRRQAPRWSKGLALPRAPVVAKKAYTLAARQNISGCRPLVVVRLPTPFLSPNKTYLRLSERATNVSSERGRLDDNEVDKVSLVRNSGNVLDARGQESESVVNDEQTRSARDEPMRMHVLGNCCGDKHKHASTFNAFVDEMNIYDYFFLFHAAQPVDLLVATVESANATVHQGRKSSGIDAS